MRITIRVKPGSSRTAVGGQYDGALIVAVQSRAVEGKATEAALTALSSAIGCRRREVRLVSGERSRSKIVEVPDDAAPRLRQLLDS